MSGILPSFGILVFWILIVLSYISKADKKRKDKSSGPAPGAYPARERVTKPARPEQSAAAQRTAEYRRAHNLTPEDFAKKAAGSSAKTKSSPKIPAREKSESYIAMAAVLSEDRKHDWMARQLADEEKARRRNFSDLGAMHEASCAADELKKSHHHDNSIDTAEIR